MLRTFKSKLITAFLITIVLAVSSISATVFWEINKYSRSSFENNSAVQLQLIDAYIAEFISESVNNVSYLAGLENSRSCSGHLSQFFGPRAISTIDPALMSPLELELFKTFKTMAEKHPAYEALYLASNRRELLFYPPVTLPKGFDPRKRAWYQNTLTSSQDTELSKAYKSATGSVVITVTAKVKDKSGATAGVAGMDVKLDSLTSLTSGLKLGKTGYIMLLENDGTILSDPRHKELSFKKGQEVEIPAFNKLTAIKKGTFESQIDGIDKFVTVLTSNTTGWKLAYIMDSAEVFEASNEMLTSVILIGFGLGILLLVGAWLLALNLLRPLNMLASSAETVAGGDVNALPDARHFSGEFLTLYTSIKKMVEELVKTLGLAEDKARDAEDKSQQAQKAVQEAKQAMTKAETARDDMLQAAGALEKIVEQVTSASQQLSNRVEEAAQGSMSQRDRTAETATAMEQMNDAVLDVAKNASRAAESADKARQEAQNGGQIVSNVVESIELVSNNAQAMSGKLDSLGKQAEGIGQIMTVITDIADQTNLLALNAAIEAARAGEAGRGFAVVADEVRKLAEKTMSATREVGSSVTAIQQEVGQAITEMGEAARLVGKSTEFAQQAGHALQDIVNIVESTADEVRAIAAASEEQSATSEEINRNTEEVNRIANQTSQSMEESTQAVRVLSQLTEEMVVLVRRLKQGG